MYACPTGALMPKTVLMTQWPSPDTGLTLSALLRGGLSADLYVREEKILWSGRRAATRAGYVQRPLWLIISIT